VIYTAQFQGKAISVNQWHGARRIGNRAMIYETAKYKQFKQDIVMQIPKVILPAKYYDLYLTVTLWKQFDTANVIKPVQDAIVQAGVLPDDKWIRDVHVSRVFHKRGETDIIDICLMEVSGSD
jgi:Holliday junction resolvase RusA-like endonuclease